ncbi:hypothetical protein [Streptomyces sp. NBC_01361]|uniref:hypothetical protein n=1 Tax=Streptomyces sp. NBC_01361 TaxID=2903838 RepID=UPI002E30F435|nr:hypothetical protein [Streptomyces sp. NBC_01361]
MQVLTGTASGLSVSPDQTQVLHHAPAEAAGGILQMAQRIAASVCLSAVPAVYLHSAPLPPEGNGPRSAYALASCACAGLLAVALVLSRLRGAALKGALHGARAEGELATLHGHLFPHTATGRLPAAPPPPEQRSEAC